MEFERLAKKSHINLDDPHVISQCITSFPSDIATPIFKKSPKTFDTLKNLIKQQESVHNFSQLLKQSSGKPQPSINQIESHSDDILLLGDKSKVSK